MINNIPMNFKISKTKREHAFEMKDSHVHEYYELLYIVSGECKLFINHNIYKVKNGDFVVIPSGDIHKTKYSKKQESERFAIGFDNVQLEWIRKLIGEEMLKESLMAQVISIPEKRREYVEALMNKMLFEYNLKDELSAGFIQSSVLELLLFIIRCKKFEENVMKEIDVDNAFIQEIATYVYNHYDEKITLDSLAAHFHISRCYLSKKFKAVTGFGFKEYLINVRIQNACTKLLKSDKSITDIAFECGFGDSNYFGDAFRRVKGMSPNKYRKVNETI